MKLKNILSILCVFFAAVSCSMEDDILNEVGATNPIDEEVSGEAYIAIKTFLASGANTKSIEEGGTIDANGEEAAINSCSLILFNGNTVQAVADGVYVGEDNVIVKNASPEAADDTVKFMVKVNQADYSLMVVANSTTKFAGCATLSDVESKIQSNNVSDLVKVGTSKISFPADFEGYTSTIESASKPWMTEVVLTQLTARVELAEFNVKGFQGSSVKEQVVVTGIDVFNVNSESYTTNDQRHKVSVYENESQNYSQAVIVYDGNSELPASYSFVSNKNALPFYSYRNLSENANEQLKIQVRFKVGNGEEKATSVFTINQDGDQSNGVKSGNIYRLILNMTVIGDKVEAELLCYTRDWVNNTISIPMEDMN